MPLEILVFVVGASSLGAEIAAARLLAPWFGASTIVWANTIAIVLVALSVGYAIGGRLADRDPTISGLSRVVLAAAVLIAIVPFVSGPFLRASVSAFDNLSIGTFVGSLLGVSVLIAVPLLLLGMVSPYAVRPACSTSGTPSRIAQGETVPMRTTGIAIRKRTPTSEPTKAPAEISSRASVEMSKKGRAANGATASSAAAARTTRQSSRVRG